MINKPLFILARVDADGNIVDYPKGGGSSAKSYIRAFDDAASARRSLNRINDNREGLRVFEVTAVEEV